MLLNRSSQIPSQCRASQHPIVARRRCVVMFPALLTAHLCWNAHLSSHALCKAGKGKLLQLAVKLSSHLRAVGSTAHRLVRKPDPRAKHGQHAEHHHHQARVITPDRCRCFTNTAGHHRMVVLAHHKSPSLSDPTRLSPLLSSLVAGWHAGYRAPVIRATGSLSC